jgi:hypothetical protein
MYYVKVVVFILPMKNKYFVLSVVLHISKNLILSLLAVASAVSPADFGSVERRRPMVSSSGASGG